MHHYLSIVDELIIPCGPPKVAMRVVSKSKMLLSFTGALGGMSGKRPLCFHHHCPRLLRATCSRNYDINSHCTMAKRTNLGAASNIDGECERREESQVGDSRSLPVPWTPDTLTDDHIERNRDLESRMKNEMILAPLTRGNNLPFRRLCCDFGANVTFSEMSFARQLLKGDRKEQALLRRACNEQYYGVQIATNVINEGVAAGLLAVESGADWIDLNCGCPIHEATRRGLGSSLLRKPQKLARLVEGIAKKLPVPLTVKVRIGIDDSSVNVERVSKLMKEAGAAALTIHGRTAQQRYKRPANWDIIESIARSESSPPVIGNGDILTYYEARHRLQSSGCLAIMVGRGALIKPWCFLEFKNGVEWHPSAEERVEIYLKLVSYMKEHFGSDDWGKRKSFYFLPWHLGFFARYRPFPESTYGVISRNQPLISTRWESIACVEAGETVEDLSLLERLLRCESEEACELIAEVLWESESTSAAIGELDKLAANKLDAWEESLRSSDRNKEEGNEKLCQG